MTFKQLLNLPVADLEALSDEQMKLYCEPFLRVVKSIPQKQSSLIDLDDPNLDNGPRRSKRKPSDNWQAEAKKLLETFGVKAEIPKELK